MTNQILLEYEDLRRVFSIDYERWMLDRPRGIGFLNFVVRHNPSIKRIEYSNGKLMEFQVTFKTPEDALLFTLGKL